MSTHVHWHEGLFLQPHHFQLLQRGFFELVRAERRWRWHYPYGVIESRLMPDELENGRIRFERLRVLMPSGVEIDYPENAEVPSLDIKADVARASEGFTIRLGVPLWMGHRANTFAPGQPADPRVKLLYRLREMACDDENTGDNSKPVQMRLLNARLMLEHEDDSDMDVLPLLRVQRAAGRGSDVPQLDSAFVPPCLVLGGSPTLRRLATELAAKVESSRDELAQKLARGGLGPEAKIEKTMKLRTLAHFGGSLPSLAEAPATTPFELYLALRELLGELAALKPAADEFKCAPYAHDHPLPCFEELDARIRGLIPGPEGRFKMIPFQANAKGHPQVTLNDEDLDRPTGYFLGIKTARVDRPALVKYVDRNSDQFKCVPISLEGSAVRGADLSEENFPPADLPAERGLYYFRIALKEGRRWQTFKDDKSAVLEWMPSEFDLSDASFALYMTLPS
jgi:type VI secretion system ImpJ/VasE family protein